MRVRWVPVVVAPALVLVVLLVFLCSVVVALVAAFPRSGRCVPAPVASCTILLMLARWGAHPHTHPRTHIRTYTHSRAIIFRPAIFRLCTEIFSPEIFGCLIAIFRYRTEIFIKKVK